VILSAHTSGWSPDRQVRLIALFADNMGRYAAGMPLINVVDKEKGY
jgi:phosphoglycerate dehydrogenase-like enzyme